MDKNGLITRIEDGILSAIQEGTASVVASSADAPQSVEADGRIVIDGDVPLTGIAHAVVSRPS